MYPEISAGALGYSGIFNQLTYLLDRMYDFSSSCIRRDVKVSCNVKWLKKYTPELFK